MAKPRGNADVYLAIVLLVPVFYLSGNTLPGIRFDRERIDVWVFDQQVQVVGRYHYRNDSPWPQALTIGVPFPQGDGSMEPGYFALSETDATGSPGPVIRTLGRDRKARILFGPREDKWVKVEYIQQAWQGKGRYILTTTLDWKAPLERGEYYLHLARGLELEDSDYPLDEGHSFQRSYFSPEHDWRFRWRKAR